MSRKSVYRLLVFSLLAVMLLAPLSASAAPVGVPQPPKPLAYKAIFFAADGMRPDIMERYASEGDMPTYAELMAKGVKGDNGLVQAFPPNTGVGWYTLATGAYPSEHGSTNNTFFRSGDLFNNRTAAFSNDVLQADTIAEAAERAGKRVVSVEWAGGSRTSTPLQGPVIDYRGFYSNRGLWTNWDVPGQPAGAAAFGVQYQRYDLADAAGWSNVPASYSPAKQGTFDIASSSVADDQYDFYVYDTTNDGVVNYDKVLIAPHAAGKDGSAAIATLMQGGWADVKVTLTSGKTAGFYVKAMLFAPDLSQFSLFFTSASARHCNLQRLWVSRRLRRRPEQVVPQLDRRRLCRVRIGVGRCRHLCRAGPEVERRPPHLPQVHPGHGACAHGERWDRHGYGLSARPADVGESCHR